MRNGGIAAILRKPTAGQIGPEDGRRPPRAPRPSLPREAFGEVSTAEALEIRRRRCPMGKRRLGLDVLLRDRREAAAEHDGAVLAREGGRLRTLAQEVPKLIEVGRAVRDGDQAAA